MTDDTQEWWYPKIVDTEYCQLTRDKYPQDAYLSDDEIIEEYFNGRKYAVTWDNMKDANDQFEALADAYLKLKREIELLNGRF